MSDQVSNSGREDLEIAIVGMAGRFPGAGNLAEFWRNIRDGVESISAFTDEELLAFAVDPASLRDQNFVKVGAILPDIDLFDAAFFGYSPREAEMIDPQHRVFLECAWEAIESAGYHPDSYEGLIGVYAGTSLSAYLLFNVLARGIDPQETFEAMLGNDKDFLSTRVSYRLNLRGPGIDVQTACSTSLVAVHLACQALLSYQCDMALAGGVSIQTPQRTGHYYRQGGINSPDGHCRAFDAKAAGTVFGSGAGIVVLRRLADALMDGDQIHAVIKGSAINNDGSSKLGYTAPSVEGQAQVISLAQVVAGVSPESISYVETHGTGTPLGDPAEIMALTKAFRQGTEAKGFCGLGSVKTNIGHLDAAAGVAGLLKTVLALKHGMMPPSLHFETPNPGINFADSPFFVNAGLKAWERGNSDRRAGVSSFGIGGTNAHVIVEEAPPQQPSSQSRPWQLIALSARTVSALEKATANLASYFRERPGACLADVCYTLQVGRKRFNYRRVAVCRDPDDARTTLETLDPQRTFTRYQEPGGRTVAFMFPGGGAQYVNMGLELYDQEEVFRRHIDECSGILLDRHGFDLRGYLYPGDRDLEQASERMKRASVGLPALFSIEYALAKLWMKWGIRPDVMIGHSLGEYAAACLSGVFTLEDALSLVHLRGNLFERLPRGAMLSVPLSEEEVRVLLDERLAIAAINGPAQCVVSGPVDAIDSLSELLSGEDIEFRRLQIDVAAHSPVVDLMLDEFSDFVATLNLGSPTIPFLSNVTGAWIQREQATDPSYWASHLRQTVRFADGVQELLADPACVLLEVGPGQTLSSLARLQLNKKEERLVVASMRHPHDRQTDLATLLAALGKVWTAGAEIDWKTFYEKERRGRVQLPTYPFERQRYWIDGANSLKPEKKQEQGKRGEISEWYYIPSWKRTADIEDQKQETEGLWMVFEDEAGIGEEIVKEVRRRGEEAIGVRRGDGYGRGSTGEYYIDERKEEDYERLIGEARRGGKRIGVIVHAWGVSRKEVTREGGGESEQEAGIYSLLRLARALERQEANEDVHILVVSTNLEWVESGDRIDPNKSTILGPCKVIPQEYDGVSVSVADIALQEPGGLERERLIGRLIAEARSRSTGEVIAYRGKNRWAQIYEPLRLSESPAPNDLLRERGVYLITGGIGNIGLKLARFLAREVKAKLALIQRTPFLPEDEWGEWLAGAGQQDEASARIAHLEELKRMGAELLIASADVADRSQMSAVIRQVRERFGRIDAVIHGAGMSGEKVVKPISQLSVEDCEEQFRAKARGLYVLEEVFRAQEPDLFVLLSSNAAVLGGLGLAGYSAANLFMDAFAVSRSGIDGARWLSVNWDGWLPDEHGRLVKSFQTTMDQYAMTPDEGSEAFSRAAALRGVNRLVVSTGDLPSRHDFWIKRKGRARAECAGSGGAPQTLQARPVLGAPYVAPRNEIEEKIAGIWQELLGIECPGVHDNFFELGGDSLISLKVISRLKKEIGVALPVVAIFEGPTISELAKVIGQNHEAPPDYEASRSRGERRREKRRKRYKESDDAERASISSD
jgi:phthiocerol/phenolphthiocerol synthesis type-I polyketide synthase E